MHDRAIDRVGAPFTFAHKHLTSLKVRSDNIDLHLAAPLAADRSAPALLRVRIAPKHTLRGGLRPTQGVLWRAARITLPVL